MITPYLAQQPIDDFGFRFPGLLYSATVAAATDTAVTVPGIAQVYKAIFKVGEGVEMWVALNATAAVPAGASFASTTSELIPVGGKLCREIKAGDVLHFYSTAGGTVSVVLYAFGTNN